MPPPRPEEPPLNARLRRPTALLTLAAVLAALLAGCGGGEEPPSPSALLVDSARAVRAQDPARFRFAAQARADDIVPARSAGANVRRLAGGPASLGLSGAFSPEAIEAKGSVQGGGQTFTAEALAGARELYVRFLGQWYGTREIGLDGLRRQAEERGGRSTGQAFDEAIADIERYGERVFEGEVEEGPEVEGEATWQAEGTLSADGVAELAREKGERVTPEDRELLVKLAEGTRVTYVVGRQDKLPRRVAWAFDLRPAELGAAARDDDEQLRQVERVRASFTVNISDWGQPVEIRPPSDYEPIEQLAGRLLGGAVGSGSPGAPGGP